MTSKLHSKIVVLQYFIQLVAFIIKIDKEYHEEESDIPYTAFTRALFYIAYNIIYALVKKSRSTFQRRHWQPLFGI